MTAGERLAVGQVRGFHGLRGTLRVESLSDRAEERFAVGRVLYMEGRETELTIVESTPDALGWRVRFAEVPDRNAAEALRDVYLEAVVAPGEELPRGEFYWHEIIGATVKDVDDSILGKVVDVYRAGGADVVVVRGPAGEIDVALVKAVVRVFDPAKGEIVVDGDALGLRDDAVVDAPEVEETAVDAPAAAGA
ncbi:MAG TPA: ribosome maturation factor RimM [Terriglobales bacterium]|nr:ribosome maturation factor RimM [Terriglobales bacterium]